MIRNWVKYCTNGCYQWTHSVFVKHIYYTSSCSWVIGVRFLGPISWRWELSKPKSTKILFLAPSWKYHLSNGPLSRGRLIPRLVCIFFFSVSQFLLQVLSRTFTQPAPFLESAWSLSHPDRGFCPSHSGYTTQFWFLERFAQCWWVSNLSTNPLCGPFHINCQGISRFSQFTSVFLTFEYFLPPNLGALWLKLPFTLLMRFSL